MYSFSIILALLSVSLLNVLATPLVFRQDLGDLLTDAPGAGSYTGAGGQAPGGEVENCSSLLDLFSGNGGSGGNTNSGDALSAGSQRNSYTGVGGQSPGGSVRQSSTPCSGGLARLFSGNAGHGGSAPSGDSLTGAKVVKHE